MTNYLGAAGGLCLSLQLDKIAVLVQSYSYELI